MRTLNPKRVLREQRRRRTRRQAEWQDLTELERRRARVRRKEWTRRRAMTALMLAGAVVLFVVLPWLLWWGPYVIDADRIDEAELKKGSAALVTGLRTAVVAFTAALGAGIALLYTARTYRLTRRGQITDRFTKALERLGSGEIYVRIGGILALEQIVRDASEQAATDAAHVLGHFIRHRAPRTAPRPTPTTPTAARCPPNRPPMYKPPSSLSPAPNHAPTSPAAHYSISTASTLPVPNSPEPLAYMPCRPAGTISTKGNGG